MELLLLPGLAFLISLAVKNVTITAKLNKAYQTYKGTPYKWGGTTPSGFDCSGWTQFVYKNYLNKAIPRTAAQQANVATRTTNPKIGDLLFFAVPGSNNISHVGIYINENEFLHSGSTNGVEKTTLNSYWAPRLRFYGQI